MKRNLKMVGLAMAPVTSLGATLASSASAEFVTGSHATELTVLDNNQQRFTTGGGNEVRCEEVEAHGTAGTGPATEITIEPTYSGCHLTRGGSNFTAKVDTNGCHYTFTTNNGGDVHIDCPEGEAIELTAFILGAFRNCLDFAPQTPTSPAVSFTNGTDPVSGKMDVTLKSEIEGITYTETGLCQSGETHDNDAHYEGEVTIGGHDGITGDPVDVTAGH